MTWSQPIIEREWIIKSRSVCFASRYMVKAELLSLTSIKEQRKLWIITDFFFVNVCRRLVCVVYFFIVSIGYTLL